MELLNFLSGDWGKLKYLAGAIILPLLYLRESSAIHKEISSLIDPEGHTSEAFQDSVFLERIKGKLSVFQLEWWLVLSISILLLSVFLLADLGRTSDIANCRPAPDPLTEQKATVEADDTYLVLRSKQGKDIYVKHVDSLPSPEPCKLMAGILNLYATFLVFCAVFVIYLAKSSIQRDILRQTSLNLNLQLDR